MRLDVADFFFANQLRADHCMEIAFACARTVRPQRVAVTAGPSIPAREDVPVNLRIRFRPERCLSIALLLCIATPSAVAGTISTNVVRNFSFAGSFESPIDAVLQLDSASDASRLANDRLGSWVGTTATLTYTHLYGISLLDPGVSTPPGENRPLFRARSDAHFTGGELVPPDHVSVVNKGWVCEAQTLKCNTSMVYAQRTGGFTTTTFTGPAAVLQGFSLTTSSQTETLLEGVQLLASEVGVHGTLTVHAQYAGKTTQAYVADALQATVAAAALPRAERYAGAVTDVAALRAGSYTSLTVPADQRVINSPELHEAHATLVLARDSETLFRAAAAGATQFASRGALLRQIWDLGAGGVPALGRSSAGLGADLVLPSGERELAVLKAVMASGDDASFLAALATVPEALVVSADPLLTVDGAKFGLAGAELSIYYVGADDGLATLNLRAAGRHAIYRDFSDDLFLFEGPADGVGFIAPNGGEGFVLPNEGSYFGEGTGGVLTIMSHGAALRVGLDNLYSPQLLAVASFGVTPVPEPVPVVLMLAGLAWVARTAGRRRDAGRG